MHFLRLALALLAVPILGYGTALFQVLSVARSAPSPQLSGHALLVLGKRTAQTPDTDFQNRIDRLQRLVDQLPDTFVIASGGALSGSTTEAAWVASALPDYPVVLEQYARSTRENLRLSVPLAEGRPLAVLTSRYHLARTASIAKSEQIEVLLVPAEQSWTYNWTNMVSLSREALLYWPAHWGW